MADLEDELLALAGGDEGSDSGDEGSIAIDGDASSAASSPARSPPRREDRNDESRSRAAASGSPGAKRSRRGKEASEDEGEASSAPGSPESDHSAPMDESDSDDDAGHRGSDSEDKYTYEGMYASASEKQQIMSMREFEREQILAERAQEIERRRQNRLLRQLVSNQELEEKKQQQQEKKRKASAADLDDGAQRKTARQRTKGSETANVALDNLRKARAEKSERQRKRIEDREKRGAGNSSPIDRQDDDYDDDHSDGERRARGYDARSRTPEVKDAPPPELRDVEHLRVGRSRFAKVCFYPGFESAMMGCFVRIAIGPHPETREEVYRMGLIKGFKNGHPYAMQKANGQSFVTDQYVVAAHGKAQREWPFISCSDSRFTEAEWHRYKATCAAEGVTIPDKRTMISRIDDIERLVQRTWTDAELQQKLDREISLKKRFMPVDREALEIELARAQARGETVRAAEIQQKLDAIVPQQRLAFKTTLSPAKKGAGTGVSSQQARLAEVNMQNRKRNAEEVRKAQIMERRKAQEIEAAIAKGEDVQEDTSRRLKTKAKFLLDVNDMGQLTPAKKPTSAAGSGTSTPAGVGTPKLGALKPGAGALAPQIAKLQQANTTTTNGIPSFHRPLLVDDIIGALDLDIDVEIE